MGVRDDLMGLADKAPSANTFWVEALVFKGKRGMIISRRRVTSPIRHLAL
jgi:hypothetical protein